MEKWLKDSRGAQLRMRLLKESGMAKSECFKNIFYVLIYAIKFCYS
jgi:hypothetical protein